MDLFSQSTTFSPMHWCFSSFCLTKDSIASSKSDFVIVPFSDSCISIRLLCTLTISRLSMLSSVTSEWRRLFCLVGFSCESLLTFFLLQAVFVQFYLACPYLYPCPQAFWLSFPVKKNCEYYSMYTTIKYSFSQKMKMSLMKFCRKWILW